jgi:hypothetical protein
MSRDEILTYFEMCQRERMSLQRGMNFFDAPAVSIVLMSRRRNAPYEDAMSADGSELIYEGHDVPRSPGVEPKRVDQPWATTSGAPTENAKFAGATERSDGLQLVRVYEKLQQGIWSDKGLFELTGYEYLKSGHRKVFKFHMRVSDAEEPEWDRGIAEHRRIIPGWVKQEVFKRDAGQCAICGAKDNLHFDHDLPFSKGGASILPDNVRILCARHNLEKGSKIR